MGFYYNPAVLRCAACFAQQLAGQRAEHLSPGLPSRRTSPPSAHGCGCSTLRATACLCCARCRPSPLCRSHQAGTALHSTLLQASQAEPQYRALKSMPCRCIHFRPCPNSLIPDMQSRNSTLILMCTDACVSQNCNQFSQGSVLSTAFMSCRRCCGHPM